MIQNIETIKKEQKNHIEIDITYPIVPGTIVKYITLNDDDAESFYLGGEFVKKGYEKILGCKRTSKLTYLLKKSDFVTLHLPMNKKNNFWI